MGPLHRLGQNIRDARAAKGLSQDRLAEAAGIDRSYMGIIERGESSPTITTLLKIVKVLDVPVTNLLEGVEADDSE